MVLARHNHGILATDSCMLVRRATRPLQSRYAALEQWSGLLLVACSRGDVITQDEAHIACLS